MVSGGLLITLSLAPFILFLYLLLFRKISILKVSVVVLFLVLFSEILFWKIVPIFILSSFTKGFLVAFDIFIILSGAIFFLEIINRFEVVDNITHFLGSVSPDYRVQIILLAWFLENFIEGTAGFGTPAAIVAPILVGIGLSPISAVVITLMGNSVAGAFGAVGTPIRVGFADVGLTVNLIPLYTVLFNSVGFLVPVFMLWFLVSKRKDRKDQFFEALPFALWAGVAFTISSIAALVVGQEFPSILGSAIGFFLIFITIRMGLFIPKNIRKIKEFGVPEIRIPLGKALLPYLILIILLIFGKMVFQRTNIFNPGFAFILSGLIIIILWKLPLNSVIFPVKNAFKRTLEPFVVITCMSTIVRLMINSGRNLSGIPSSLELLAKGLETQFLPFFAPIIGSFGSFITGSATVSNIMFGSFLSTAGRQMGFNPSVILALELVGAAAGNMIAISDVLAAEAVVGLKREERGVIRGVIIPCTIYVLLAGIIGMLVSWIIAPH